MAKTKDPTPEALALAERVRRWIESLGLNQAQLARDTGLSASTISRILSAEEPPGREAMIKIAGACGQDLASFFNTMPLEESS